MMQKVLRPHLEAASHWMLKSVDTLPDYADCFGESPRAAYTALVFASLLSVVGLLWLPQPIGLRCFKASELVAASLLCFMGLRHLTVQPLKLIQALASLLQMVLQVFFQSDALFAKPADVVGFSLFHTLSFVDSLPGLIETRESSSSPTMKMICHLGFFIVPASITSLSVYCAFASSEHRDKVNRNLSMQLAAFILFSNTCVMILSQLS